ncbi:MAG TPA: phosphoribosylaminoimidazolesuccinocarboxamide synthase [Roseiflexaceae bacterium]|nr:phosphoribosylaminoimidazolesuccinocarboxamide synthase [Roseiflexaceae bacterium]HMP41471.1 phosphoribosylaminoimidazolesuccinocarboxamide synthase [Roseiflexaceae bacterium]
MNDLLLAEGKTKRIYAHPADPALAIIEHKDTISAGDGARRHVIAGKAALSGRTTANVFVLLGNAGIATHYVAAETAERMVVQRCHMIPLEVVTRRIATGSYLRRFPATAEGTRFEPPIIEFFLKDDARHDPLLTPAEIVSQQVATAAEVAHMAAEAQRVFVVLEAAWAAQDVTLCDLKIEFGRDSHDTLIVADVIDNDSWRIWPGGDKRNMLDKQIYRNLAHVTADDLDAVRRRYALVADLTDHWREGL